MPGIGIITNPNSRRNRRFPEQMRRLGYVLGEDGGRHALTRSPDDIHEVARRFLARDIEILALNGGDGTNHVTLTAFIEVYGDHPLPLIAFLRGGTMNTISNAIGIKGTPGEVLLNITERYHLDQPFEVSHRDIMAVDDGERVRYGFIFGNGLFYNFLEAYYAGGDPSPRVALTTFSRAVASAVTGGELSRRLFRPFRAEVTVDGERWEQTRYTAIVASTIEQVGLGFRPTFRCRERPGAFHFLGILGGPLQIASQLHRFRLGQPIDDRIVRDAATPRVTFASDEPIEYMIDGDLHRAPHTLTVTTGPRLRVIKR